ncbi:hypothetical protein Dimus_007509 [Dionaea muscipula]
MFSNLMDMLGILNMASRTSNSRSGSSSNVVGHVSNCRNYGIRRKMYTSRTDDNPGRRFMQCPRRDCNHFTWIDDPLSKPASEIIRGLLRRINMLEAQLAAGNTHPSEETQQMVADTILATPVNVGEPVRHVQFPWVFMICTWVGVVFMLFVFKICGG